MKSWAKLAFVILKLLKFLFLPVIHMSSCHVPLTVSSPGYLLCNIPSRVTPGKIAFDYIKIIAV